MSAANSSNPGNPGKKSASDGKAPVRYPDDPAGTKKGRTPLKEHRYGAVRFFAKAGYTVWIIVMVIGLVIAFAVSLFLV